MFCNCIILGRCCFCLNLRTGCIVIGVHTLLFWPLVTTFYVYEGMKSRRETGLRFDPLYIAVLLLTEAVIRISIAAVLIYASVKRSERLLGVWENVMLTLFLIVLTQFVLSLLQGTTSTFSVVGYSIYTMVRTSFYFYQLVVVHSFKYSLTNIAPGSVEDFGFSPPTEPSDIRYGTQQPSL